MGEQWLNGGSSANQKLNTHAARLGFKYMKRKTVKDSRVCKLCQQLEGRVYLISDLQKNPHLAIAHPNERCYLIEVSDIKGERLYNEQNK